FSRPLWYAQLSSSNDPDYPNRLVKVAMSKLRFIQSEKLNFNIAISIISSRIQLDISPQSKFATTLISNYMYLMMYVSEDCQTVIKQSPSEPLLAIAAVAIMNQDNVRINDILNYLVQRIRKDKHAATRLSSLSVKFAEPMRIFDYLKSLVVNKVFEDIWKKIENTDLTNGWIHFNHFVKITYTLIKLNLLEFAKHRVAACYKELQKGADLIIPVLINGKLHLNNVTFILVQVKNHSKKTSYKIETTLKLTPEYMEIEDFKDFKLPYLSLYMQISIDQHNHEVLLTRNRNQISVVLFGLTRKLYSCLDLKMEDETFELEKSLSNLRISSVNLMKLIKNENKKKIIHHMQPLVYNEKILKKKRLK
ncbi:2952_t:CDS:2, partial [Funneliformis caledonium]